MKDQVGLVANGTPQHIPPTDSLQEWRRYLQKPVTKNPNYGQRPARLIGEMADRARDNRAHEIADKSGRNDRSLCR